MFFVLKHVNCVMSDVTLTRSIAFFCCLIQFGVDLETDILQTCLACELTENHHSPGLTNFSSILGYIFSLVSNEHKLSFCRLN